MPSALPPLPPHPPGSPLRPAGAHVIPPRCRGHVRRARCRGHVRPPGVAGAAGPPGMSRKQAAKARPAAGARKGRRPRHSPAGPAPGPAPGHSGGLAGQLRALGLKLREVPGDGNCLFRALGDQLEGHSRNHLRHRQETVEFMVRQRGDFEPFVEDDVPFDKHVANLAKPGTFAGNDAIVAFARNNQMNVVIHQLNTPLWQIRGTDRSDARELHIAYRHGEHYDSVRRVSDDSETPACLRMEMLSKNDLNKAEEVKPQKGDSEDETEVEMEDAVQKVCDATGCSDIDLISHVLEVEDYDVESAILAILQVKEGEGIGTEEQQEPSGREQKSCSGTLWEENGTGSRIFGNQSLHQGEAENSKGKAGPREENRASRNPKVAKKQRKEQQRLEKKKRQEERHRQKVLATKGDNADTRTETDPANHVTLVKAMAALNI